MACLQYDFSSVTSRKKLDIQEKTVYVSTQSRSEDTAKSLLVGKKNFIKTDLLNEIPLVSFIDTNIYLPTMAWMIIGRLQWYFNHTQQKEIRTKSIERINQFLDHLEQKQQDCIIIGHGFYFAQMVNEMKKRGIMGNMRKKIKNDEIREFIYDRPKAISTDN